jgi:hypothetical protein
MEWLLPTFILMPLIVKWSPKYSSFEKKNDSKWLNSCTKKGAHLINVLLLNLIDIEL